MIAERRIHAVPSDDLGAWIDSFLDDLTISGRSPGTIRFYRGNLYRFHWWCQQNHVDLTPEAIKPDHIRRFIMYVKEAPVRWDLHGTYQAEKEPSPNLPHVYYRSLRPFFKWLMLQEIISDTPIRKVVAPRLRVEQPDPFDDQELKRMASVLVRSPDTELAIRDRAIVALLLDLGLRSSELTGLNIEDFSLASGDLKVIRGKGGKGRQLRIGASARRPLRRYWIQHRRLHSDSGPLFLSRTGTRLTHSGLKLLLERLGERSQVHPVNPHRFRHTAAVQAVRAGMPLFQLQMMLGHTSLEMTRMYVKLVEADLARASQLYSPLDHLKLGL